MEGHSRYATAAEVDDLSNFLRRRCGGLKAAFCALDKSGAGFLSAKVFEDGLQRLGYQREAAPLFRALDPTHSNSISITAFVDGFRPASAVATVHNPTRLPRSADLRGSLSRTSGGSSSPEGSSMRSIITSSSASLASDEQSPTRGKLDSALEDDLIKPQASVASEVPSVNVSGFSASYAAAPSWEITRRMAALEARLNLTEQRVTDGEGRQALLETAKQAPSSSVSCPACSEHAVGLAEQIDVLREELAMEKTQRQVEGSALRASLEGAGELESVKALVDDRLSVSRTVLVQDHASAMVVAKEASQVAEQAQDSCMQLQAQIQDAVGESLLRRTELETLVRGQVELSRAELKAEMRSELKTEMASMMLQVSSASRDAESTVSEEVSAQSLERIRVVEANLQEITRGLAERVSTLEGYNRDHRLQLEALGRAIGEESEHQVQSVSQVRVELDRRVRSLEDWRLVFDAQATSSYEELHAESSRLSAKLAAVERVMTERDGSVASTVDVSTVSTDLADVRSAARAAAGAKEAPERQPLHEALPNIVGAMKVLSGRLDATEQRNKEYGDRLATLDGRLGRLARENDSSGDRCPDGLRKEVVRLRMAVSEIASKTALAPQEGFADGADKVLAVESALHTLGSKLGRKVEGLEKAHEALDNKVANQDSERHTFSLAVTRKMQMIIDKLDKGRVKDSIETPVSEDSKVITPLVPPPLKRIERGHSVQPGTSQPRNSHPQHTGPPSGDEKQLSRSHSDLRISMGIGPRMRSPQPRPVSTKAAKKTPRHSPPLQREVTPNLSAGNSSMSRPGPPSCCGTVPCVLGPGSSSLAPPRHQGRLTDTDGSPVHAHKSANSNDPDQLQALREENLRLREENLGYREEKIGFFAKSTSPPPSKGKITSGSMASVSASVSPCTVTTPITVTRPGLPSSFGVPTPSLPSSTSIYAPARQVSTQYAPPLRAVSNEHGGKGR